MPTIARGITYTDLNFLGNPRVIATAVLEDAGGAALVDPGPSTCLDTLRASLREQGIGPADVRTILLTHIHLDHAGATGTLVRENPAIRVCVHEAGAPHMVDPAKLLHSAGRLYGDDMDRLWGEFLPVPAQNIRELRGGEQLDVAEESVDISGADQVTAERMRRLIERKNEMSTEVADLERQIDEMSAEAGSEQQQATESFDDALRNIRDNKIRERIQYSRGLPGARSPDFTRDFEQQTTEHLMELRDQLRQASEAIGEPVDDRTMESLDQARDMVRNMESLNRRLQARADENARRGLGQRPGEEAQGQQGEGQQGQGQQGQEGQQGQGGQQGQQGGGGGPDGLRDMAGAGFGPGGSGWARGLTPEDIRQFRGEYRERAREMADLREQLSDAGVGVEELDDVIRSMRALDDRRVYDDMEEILRLQTQILEGVKRFEFGLRRAAGEDDPERLLLSGSDEVPQGFRQLIEEYYRSLSRTPGG